MTKQNKSNVITANLNKLMDELQVHLSGNVNCFNFYTNYTEDGNS